MSPHASKDTIALNPHIFPGSGVHPPLRPAIPQPDPGQPPSPPKGQTGRQVRRGRRRPIGELQPAAVVRVVLIALRHRILDDDNLASSYKHVRDAIADELTGHQLAPGAADSLFEWSYCQHLTRGPQLTVVLIQNTNPLTTP